MVTRIQLFGSLKKFSSAGVVVLELPTSCSVQEVRTRVKEKLAGECHGEFNGVLIDRAALASDNRILPDEEQLFQPRELALLPPVCGG